MGVPQLSSSKLVQIDTFFDGVAAHQAKSWLNQEGIPAFVEGAHANSGLYIGSALAGVKLLVAADDKERACNLLQQYHTDGYDRTSWFCGSCQEVNEPSFDLCWSCGENREDVEALKPTPSLRIQPENDESPDKNLNLPEPIETGNPYQPPQVMLPADPNPESTLLEEDRLAEAERAEEVIQRAWRASVIGLGLVFPFPILHLYSVTLLLGVDANASVSQRARRQYRFAWGINIVLLFAICIAGVVLLRR